MKVSKPVEIVGMSFTDVTVKSAVSVSVLNAVVPPLDEASAVFPGDPVVRSHARNVIASLMVPL
ncbi:hypothetical protein Pla22_28830 [Rubripirellula amarantea]|uniref:Uncharacterized protein n=1 Tax=Rubripirellula amarantea TaxID=2527999 RepID=A0A5C5WJJ7_9BACT|nr:hypothetical protein Pla22_28830 [Rubripirellula amarantea]